SGNVNPLTRELFVVPVTPTRSDPLRRAIVSIAFSAIVLERILHAETALLLRKYYSSIKRQKLVHGEVLDMVMTVAGRKYEPLSVRVVRVAAITNHKVPVSTVQENCVESKDSPIAGCTNSTFLKRTSSLIEETIDDLHLRYEALRVDSEVWLA